MSLVLLLKLVHVLSAIVAVGANVTYPFWLRLAGRDRDRLVWTINGIRRLDRTVANPAYGVLLLTGVLMVLGGIAARVKKSLHSRGNANSVSPA